MCFKILKTVTVNGSPAPLFETDGDRIAYVSRPWVHPLAQVPWTAVAQVTEESTISVSEEVSKLVRLVRGEMARLAMQAEFAIENANHFRLAYLAPVMAARVLEMTALESPRSLRHRYHLIAKGLQWLKQHPAGGPP